MMSVLDDATAAAVLAEARRLGMDAIVEVHDEAELERALALGAAIVGINNRDLKTLKTDLAVTERLAPLVPRGRAGHFGIGDCDPRRCRAARAAGRRLPRRIGADGGARHVRCRACPGPWAGQIVRPHARARTSNWPRGRGNARRLDLRARLAARRDARGGARAGRRAAQRTGLKTVGVFRDSALDDLAAPPRAPGLDVVQLHGRGRPGGVRAQLRRAIEIWAATTDGRRRALRRRPDPVRQGRGHGRRRSTGR